MPPPALAVPDQSGPEATDRATGEPAPRDVLLLRAVAEGFTSGEIAEHLGLSEQSVKNEMVRLLRSLRVPSRTAAVTLALQRGWLDLAELRVLRTVGAPGDGVVAPRRSRREPAAEGGAAPRAGEVA